MHDAALPSPDALAELPIFPLPNCVLLPGGLLPLHVFEPRYRELVREALAARKLMGIVRLKPGFEADYEGRPPVFDVCGVGSVIDSVEHASRDLDVEIETRILAEPTRCLLERCGVGRILCSEELPDGRFALVLRGVARIEIARELDTPGAYRRVEARLLDDARVDPMDALDHQRRLIALCDRLAEVIDKGGPQLRDLARGADTPGACADAIAAALIMDPDARQELLEATCPLSRLQRTLGHVSHLLCELAPCDSAVN